ncbi:MAG: LysR family transcriptional regulator substrate-binding protein, partial [Candidatus Binatia bacterium]
YRHEPLAVFVPRNHPLAKKQKVTWQDLEQTAFIARKRVRGRSTSNRFFENMRKLGFKPQVAMRCSSPEAVKAAVKRKMGIGILFKETIAPEVRKGEFKIIKLPVGNFEGQSFIVYRKDRPLSLNAQEFLALLRKSKEKRN